ncbi:hypothetical protein [Clostridium algidicarnis]|uniref:Uncharacterized protein n=2 Tax=Clostridium algidicarnis TaxID=37659 RepID=A0A2S6G1K0_9CLOT|nr:hypothetical protein [Clostridium algidicarnis]MBB6631265.1 hypothetical protein [Clostridium algidicarnis]MBU3193823.1 hypothetical protein [Clostridium algidicarnis]MBU3219847.1 hypothetical protein [Clostridium algidicarnis]MCB2285686.1 hypothetical protein [Clostridium algidicarnis]PPK49771.1 hypothetical protein BD821_101437 [Clostridium algidicarnis DSM 15099]
MNSNNIYMIIGREIYTYDKRTKCYEKFKYEDIDFIYFKNKKLNIILEGEEIYNLKLNLPRMNNISLKKNIEKEVNLLFKKDDILFDYEVIKSSDKNLITSIKCINTDKYEIIDRYFAGCKSLRIIPIQEVLTKYIKNKAKVKEGIVIALIKEHLYFIILKYGDIVFCILNKDADEKNTNNLCEESLNIITKSLEHLSLSIENNMYLINLNLDKKHTNDFNIKRFNIKTEELFYVN